MADESSQSISIAASPERVMAVIADFDRYPEWADGVRRCEVAERDDEGRAIRVRFVIDAGMIKDDFILAYAWDGDTRVDWTLVKGQLQRQQRGSYALEPSGEGTLVTYTLSVDLAVPMLGMIKRKAERAIMDTALNRLKSRVEG